MGLPQGSSFETAATWCYLLVIFFLIIIILKETRPMSCFSSMPTVAPRIYVLWLILCDKTSITNGDVGLHCSFKLNKC